MDKPVTPTVLPTAMSSEICLKCKKPVAPTDNFCPNCGTKIVRRVSIWRQIWIYFVSVAFPPLGLIWTFRYFRSQYKQVKWVGIIATVLTIISLIVTTWLTLGFINSVNQQLTQQLNVYPQILNY